MLANIFPQCHYVIVTILAFGVNVPLGYLRENTRRFSCPWFFWIHASIPLLVYMRITLDVSHWFIPISIFFAVWGQGVGGKWRRKKTYIESSAKCVENFLDKDVTIVLMNMGGPKTLEDISSFYRRLFSDSRLIRFPLSFIFQKAFACLLVFFRFKKMKEKYALVGGGSPIFNSTKNQCKALEDELKTRGHNINVTFAFNYSEPLSENVIKRIKADGKRYILPLSLYPHYSKTTTGSSLYSLKNAAYNEYRKVQFLNVPEYFEHDGYIQAFVNRIYEQMLPPNESLDDFFLIFSAHSLPMYVVDEGDPYPMKVSKTVAKILAKLNRIDRWAVSYQSAMGPIKWLSPSTKETIISLIEKGEKKILIVPISFVSDHIETLWEIDMKYRKLAESLGVVDFRMSRALEAHPDFICALADEVEKELTIKLTSNT